MHNFVVLISNRGSNLKSICEAGLTPYISCVISNNPDASGLEFAKKNGITTKVIDHKLFSSREKFDEALAETIDLYAPQLIVLAGFMRVLTYQFVDKYKNRIINIHPSLLPAFIGTNAQTQAFNAKIKLTGATIHFVTAQLDHGPIIAQGVVPVLPNDTTKTLADRVLTIEHAMYPFIIHKILSKQVSIAPDNLVIVEKQHDDEIKLGVFKNCVFY